MFCSIDDFSQVWTEEARKTGVLFEALTNDCLNKQLIPDYMTIGRLALHMINNLCNTAPKLGFREIEKPESADSADALVREYERVSKELLRMIKSNWADGMLEDKMEIFGKELTRSEVLSIIFLHQIHHRSQITTLMRLAGLEEVPGMFGPSASDKKRQQAAS